MTSTAEASFEIQCQWFCCSNLTKNPQKRPKFQLNWQQVANTIWWLELKRWNRWKSLPGLPTCCCKPGQGWTSSRPSPTLHPSCAGVVAFYQRLGLWSRIQKTWMDRSEVILHVCYCCFHCRHLFMLITIIVFTATNTAIIITHIMIII